MGTFNFKQTTFQARLQQDEALLQAICSTSNERCAALRTIYRSEELRHKISQWVGNNSGTKEKAEEVFRDTMVIFDRNIRACKFAGKSCWQTYFFGIARYLWLQRCRLRKFSLAELLPPHSDEPTAAFEQLWLEEKLRAEMRRWEEEEIPHPKKSN